MGLPSHRRWAIRIDLAEFAKGYVADERKSLMAFVAKQVTSQGYTRKLEPWQMKAWMTAWPWFVPSEHTPLALNTDEPVP